MPSYEPPTDLPNAISELPDDTRKGAAKLLLKNLLVALDKQEKEGGYNPVDGVSNESRAERLAIAIERAVYDSHPASEEYVKQCRTLVPNLKRNMDLIARLLNHTLTPPMLAVMTSDDLQTEKQQQETAAAKERSVRQSIIATEEDNGPRYRRTHKGDELIEGDSFVGSNEAASFPVAPSKAGSSAKARPSHIRKPSGDPARIDTQQSPNTEFDINRVFSSVKSPTVAHQRRPSGPAPAQGPGVDPDVDRLLEEDGNDSPPYSPTEETDPDVVWRGQVIMAATANFQAVVKHVAGANLAKTINLPWTTLLPRKLNVGGRIAITTATEYLCGLRWSAACDLVVASLTPATEAGKADFDRVFNYFTMKERWAVVGDKAVGNVKDTYLVPVPAGSGNQPEFLLNLEDNFLPHHRTENTLLLVVVYRNDETILRKIHGPEWNGSSNKVAPAFPPLQTSASPSPTPASFPQRSTSIAGPSFSPTTPQVGTGGFPVPQPGPSAPGQPPAQFHQPLPPQPQAQPHAQPQAQPGPTPSAQPTGDPDFTPELQEQGLARAKSILGPYASSPTVNFLTPHAYKMQNNEWHIIRAIMEREPRAREDLTYLGALINQESQKRDQEQHVLEQQQQQQQSAGQSVIQHTPAPPQTMANNGQGPPTVPVTASTPTAQQQHVKGSPPPVNPATVPLMPQPPPSVPSKQTPISLPAIPGMPASVHQSHQAAQAANQPRNVQPGRTSPPA